MTKKIFQGNNEIFSYLRTEKELEDYFTGKSSVMLSYLGIFPEMCKLKCILMLALKVPNQIAITRFIKIS